MALTYHNDHGGYFVKVGIGVQTLVAPPGDVNHPFFDPIPDLLSGSSWDLGWVHAEDTIGMYRQNGDSSVYKVGATKPPALPYDPSEDFLRYGSNLSAIAAAVRVLRGEKINLFDPGVEHQTAHPSYRGDVGASLSGGEFFGYDDPAWTTTNLVRQHGYIYPVPAYVNPLLDGHGQQRIVPRTVGTEVIFEKFAYSQPPWAYRQDLQHTLEFLEAEHPTMHFEGDFPWCHWYADVYNLRHEITNREVTIRYLFEWGECDLYFWVWDCSLTLKYEPNLPTADHHPVFDPGTGYATWETILSLGTFTYTYTWELQQLDSVQGSSFGTVPIGTSLSYEEVRTDGFIYLTNPVQGSKDGDTPDWSILRQKHYLASFKELIDERMGSIRLSSLQSTDDALTDISGTVDNNLIEALGEIDEIFSLLPEISSAMLALRRLHRKNVGGALVSTLDFLTSLNLLKSFGWDPNIQILSDTLPRMESVARRIQLLADTGQVIGRGKFTYDFPPWEFGREECRLTTRTKVVSSLDTKSVLVGVLGVRALGLLPSPSSLWDLVPFSFVIDWFGGIGARLHDLESIGFLTLMGVKSFTHSYLIESKLTQDEMDAVGITVYGGVTDPVQPAIRYYVRDVSSYMPRIADGRWDFRLPGRLPNFAIAGSLAWQVLLRR